MVSAMLPNEGWRYPIERRNEEATQGMMAGRNAAFTLCLFVFLAMSDLYEFSVAFFLVQFPVLLWFVFYSQTHACFLDLS